MAREARCITVPAEVSMKGPKPGSKTGLKGTPFSKPIAGKRIGGGR